MCPIDVMVNINNIFFLCFFMTFIYYVKKNKKKEYDIILDYMCLNDDITNLPYILYIVFVLIRVEHV